MKGKFCCEYCTRKEMNRILAEFKKKNNGKPPKDNDLKKAEKEAGWTTAYATL